MRSPGFGTAPTAGSSEAMLREEGRIRWVITAVALTLLAALGAGLVSGDLSEVAPATIR